jgi:hypothetical protein
MRISKRKGSESFSRFIFAGVPAKHVDVVVQDAILKTAQGNRLVEFQTWKPELDGELKTLMFEMGIKKGRYDLAVRDRIAIKHISHGYEKDFCKAELQISEIQNSSCEGKDLLLLLSPEVGGEVTLKKWPILAVKQGDFNLERVFWFQWSHYFTFLNKNEVSCEVPQFLKMSQLWMADADLNDANRAASRYLYALAVRLGWKKLRADQLAKYGFPLYAGTWQRAEFVTEVYRRYFNADGCGQASHEAATKGFWNNGGNEDDKWDEIALEFDEG